jgi:hypothetical protein
LSKASVSRSFHALERYGIVESEKQGKDILFVLTKRSRAVFNSAENNSKIPSDMYIKRLVESRKQAS